MDNVKTKLPEFEKPLTEIDKRIKELTGKDKGGAKYRKLIKKRKEIAEKIFSNLTSWQKVQLARHPDRPHTLDFVKGIFDSYEEFHGDRHFGDDKAIVGGPAKLGGNTVFFVGNQKGRETKDNIKRNFGMAHPEGYRKALRMMKLAEKFSFPVITFIDTPGAYPGVKAEERGQAEAIATNLKEMMMLKVPIIVVIIGEGGSGGALGIGVGDRILMLQNAVYFVCTPEACSSILWKDASMAETAADNMKLEAEDLKKLGMVDEIIKEPAEAAHRDYSQTFENLKKRLVHHLGVLKRTNPENIFQQRYKKFREIKFYKYE
ncbi:MAG: acetyl-CoA carboxylase carboxyltransferase subunit alpha [Elusimicrobia bacterium]|jgi:acetyl-CoA carboxylase carboxyl transferase subunit alpha|nr:acetyl-CoA carboxylase carboxyltransferase subunit alpha [Elusimicrobiota bacterium]